VISATACRLSQAFCMIRSGRWCNVAFKLHPLSKCTLIPMGFQNLMSVRERGMGGEDLESELIWAVVPTTSESRCCLRAGHKALYRSFTLICVRVTSDQCFQYSRTDLELLRFRICCLMLHWLQCNKSRNINQHSTRTRHVFCRYASVIAQTVHHVLLPMYDTHMFQEARRFCKCSNVCVFQIVSHCLSMTTYPISNSSTAHCRDHGRRVCRWAIRKI